MVSKIITTFEHSILRIGEQGFKESHFNALVKYNDLHGSKYFTPGHRRIIFKSYVGVIQAGDKVIEVLPKADNLSKDEDRTKNKWHSALLYMLKKAGYIRLDDTEKASQQYSKNNLLEIYLYNFLKEVELLIHCGLVKKYHKVQQNKTVLKGRLLIERQMLYNIIHKERFFIEHTIYDRNNVFNSLLKKALEIIQLTCTNYSIKQNASKLLLNFEDINSWRGNYESLDKLVFDRKTKSYTYAIELARMIIMNYNPDMSAGNKPILAILFDMNRLFEKFIYRILKSEALFFSTNKLTVNYQNNRLFWKNKTLRPDILIEFEKKDQAGKDVYCKFIVDTKWKAIGTNNPSGNDLRQMYAYNFQFGSHQSILLYPSMGQENLGPAFFEESILIPEIKHGCELYFAEIFDDSGINRQFAHNFITYLIQNQ